MPNNEQPDYKLVACKENIEIRDYSPMILAEVETGGERKEAIKEGFKILADYIFGNNTSNFKFPPTLPLKTQLGEKIAMTAPVIQEKYLDKWKVRFFMPKRYTLETLPKPNCSFVHLISLPPKRFAVIRFSGRSTDKDISRHTKKLKAYILSENLTPIGEVILAFYNPPWTLPVLRRNEIMLEIEKG